MGLYLCIFEHDDELDGIDVGSYSGFNFFRDTVTELLENAVTGTQFQP